MTNNDTTQLDNIFYQTLHKFRSQRNKQQHAFMETTSFYLSNELQRRNSDMFHCAVSINRLNQIRRRQYSICATNQKRSRASNAPYHSNTEVQDYHSNASYLCLRLRKVIIRRRSQIANIDASKQIGHVSGTQLKINAKLQSRKSTGKGDCILPVQESVHRNKIFRMECVPKAKKSA